MIKATAGEPGLEEIAVCCQDNMCMYSFPERWLRDVMSVPILVGMSSLECGYAPSKPPLRLTHRVSRTTDSFDPTLLPRKPGTTAQEFPCSSPSEWRGGGGRGRRRREEKGRGGGEREEEEEEETTE